MGNAVRKGAVTRTFRYKFGKQGGGVGAKVMFAVDGGGKIPDNAVIKSALFEPVVDFTSAGAATVAIAIPGGPVIQAAMAFDNAGFDAVFEGVTGGGEAKIDQAGGTLPTLTIAGAALTAGECDLHVEYVPGR